MKKIKKEWHEFLALLRAVPAPLVSLFVVSVFAMNLLANKSIALPFSFLALDCGILVSWFAFLSMDILTKHFGPKAATELSVFAIFLDLLFCLFFFLAAKIPGVWSESFGEGGALIGAALDRTFGGTWYILFGSTAAFVLSALVNNFSNFAVGKCFVKSPDSLAAYLCRTYISTALGQFIDNLAFALLVSHFFFGWTLLQCVTCALTGMLAELFVEAVFAGVGFRVLKKWKSLGVGKTYFSYLKSNKNNKEETA